MYSYNDMPEITRVVVIDEECAREYSHTRWNVSISIQDDGRTMKVWLAPKNL